VRPRSEPEPIVRFETPPAHQAQVDFAELRFPWGKRYALLVVVGYSRLLWLKFYLRQTMATVISGLEEAFAYFGGVPAELLFDQMKAVIVEDQRAAGRKLLSHPQHLVAVGRYESPCATNDHLARPHRQIRQRVTGMNAPTLTHTPERVGMIGRGPLYEGDKATSSQTRASRRAGAPVADGREIARRAPVRSNRESSVRGLARSREHYPLRRRAP